MTATTTSSTSSGATGTGTDRDYQSTKMFDATPDAVFDAIVSTDAMSGWWASVTGSAEEGGEFVLPFGDPETRVRVNRAERATHVGWTVLDCHLPDWVGTTMTFDLVPVGAGTALFFAHHGLTPEVECFTQCFAGWTRVLGNLVEAVDSVDAVEHRAPTQR